jgi:hypothetical protein
MNPNKKQSAIEQLSQDKAVLEAYIKEREKNLGCDFTYIRDNTSSLLISGITSMLMPSNKKQNPPSGRSAIGKQFMPIVWDIVQPFVLTWGIHKVKGLLIKALGVRN